MYNQSPNSIGPDGKPRGLLCELYSSLLSLTLTREERILTRCLVAVSSDKNPIDCLYKTWKTEGVLGWYKGTTAHLMRIAPHTVRPVPIHFLSLTADGADRLPFCIQVVTLVMNEFISRKWTAYKAGNTSVRD